MSQCGQCCVWRRGQGYTSLGSRVTSLGSRVMTSGVTGCTKQEHEYQKHVSLFIMQTLTYMYQKVLNIFDMQKYQKYLVDYL